MASSATSPASHGSATRRDFLYLVAGGFGAVGVGAALWPFIHSMNPAADVLALASTEVDLKPVQPGQRITLRMDSPVSVGEGGGSAASGSRIVLNADSRRIHLLRLTPVSR